MTKRILSLVLTLCMVLSLLSVLSVSAESNNSTANVCGDNLSYEITGSTLTIRGNGDMYDFRATINNIVGEKKRPWDGDSIKKVVIKKGVTSIGAYAFYQFNQLTEIVMEADIESIGDDAFSDCTNLKSISLPNSLKTIGKSAFSNCSDLTQITIPDNVISISETAFYGCNSLKEVVLGKKLSKIGARAFINCSSLTTITLYDNIEVIGESAFSGCDSLNNINYQGTSISSKTLFEENRKTNELVFIKTAGKLGDNITWELKNNTLTVNGTGALVCDATDREIFRRINAKKLVIGNGITELGESFISGNQSLEEVILPDSLQKLNTYTFNACKNLKTAQFPNTEFIIDGGCFQGCVNFTNVYLPETAKLEGFMPFGDISYGNPERIDITFYTPANSPAYEWATKNGFSVIISTREAFNEKFNITEPVNLTPVKSNKSLYKQSEFKDINTVDDYTKSILSLGYLNLFKGDEQGNFNPEQSLTRAECATLICRMLGYENEANNYKGKAVFDDVLSTHWASGYIFVASQLGIINGYGNGNFGPQDPVLYEQAIKMVLCAIQYNQPTLYASYGIACLNNNIPYPQGYIQLAKELDMYGNCGSSEQAPRKIIAELLYRAILKNIVVMQTDSDGNTQYAAHGNPLLKEIFGINSEEELNKLVIIQDPIIVTEPIPTEPTVPTITPSPTNGSTTDNRTVKLEELINIDYATLKLMYGMPESIDYAPRGGIGYKFRGIDAQFIFSDTWFLMSNSPIYAGDKNFQEPSAFAVCESIFTDIGNWLQTEERGIVINSLEDVKSHSPIKSFQYNCDEYSGEEHYVGEKDWYDVWITYDKDSYPISNDSEITIGSLWSLWTYTFPHYATNIEDKYLKENNGLYFCRNQSELYKADKNLSGTVVIPEGVTAICANVFKDCTNITEIVLPRTLITIGRSAFENCTSLKTIKIPTGVQFIDPDAFKNCDSLEFIKIPQSVVSGIPSGMYSGVLWDMFEDCDNLKTVVLLTSANERKYQLRFSDTLPPIENLVIGGNIDAIPFEYLSAGKRPYLKNLYISFEIQGIIGSYFGSALNSPENIYYTGSKSRISRLPELKFTSWQNKDIVCNYNDFENPYLLQCLSDYSNVLKVTINNQLLVPDYPSICQNGTYYVDAESFFSELGMNSNGTLQSFTAKGNANTVSVTVGQSNATINGKSVTLEAAPIVYSNRVYIPVQNIVNTIGQNVLWSENENTLQFDFLLFEQINKEAMEILLGNDYTFDTLYEEYSKDPNSKINNGYAEYISYLNDPLEYLKNQITPEEYTSLLTAVLVDVLLDAESNNSYLYESVMTDYSTAMAAMKLLGYNTPMVVKQGIKTKEEYCKNLALTNAKQYYESSLDVWYQSTNNPELKTAITNLKGMINRSFEEVIANTAITTMNNTLSDSLKKGILKETDKLLDKILTPEHTSFSTVTSVTKVVSAYLDTLFGSKTMSDGYSKLALIMPIRYELLNILSSNYQKIQNGEQYADDNTTELTTATAGLSAMMRAIMVYASKQAHAIYTAEHNSASDMLLRVFFIDISELYDNRYDILYNEEMKLFQNAIIVNQMRFE